MGGRTIGLQPLLVDADPEVESILQAREQALLAMANIFMDRFNALPYEVRKARITASTVFGHDAIRQAILVNYVRVDHERFLLGPLDGSRSDGDA